LRKIAVKEYKEAEKDTWKFDQYFLDSVQKHGRLYEIETMLRYKMDKKNLFEDTKMGMSMFLKGRMGILPHNIKDRKALKEMFERIKAQDREGKNG
jgi:heterodisulfide reductase subunit C